jgi:hypothetical protein
MSPSTGTGVVTFFMRKLAHWSQLTEIPAKTGHESARFDRCRP